MSQYRFSLQKAVSRGKGQSAVAKAAYNAREQLHDERKDQFTRDYGKPTKNSDGKDDILFTGIFLDTKLNPPEWAKERSQMWNAQVASEKRKDAREAQEIIVNLPWELTQKQREYMLTDFCREVTRGTRRIADANMHKAPKHGDDRNIHAHILLTVREIGQDGSTGKRLEVTPEQLDNWKEKWAARGARELRKAGFSLEADRWAVGHLTKEKQCDAALKRLDLEHAATLTGPATKHLGPEAAAMERNGKGSNRSDIRREDLGAGQEMVKLKRELALIEKQILTEILAMQREPRGLRQSEMTPHTIATPVTAHAPVEKAATDAERLAARAKIDLSKYRPERKGQQNQERTVSQKPPDRDRER
jgi:hypothetical protein